MSKLSTVLNEYQNNDMKGFLRFLFLKEREKRTRFLDRILSWYHKQLFIAQCTKVGEGLKFIGRTPISVIVGDNGSLIVGKDVTIKSTCRLSVTTHITQDAKLEIGDRVRMGSYSSIRVADRIKIGDDCMIAPYVRIFDYNAHPINPVDPVDTSKKRNIMETPRSEVRPIKIEENVWIGEHAFILAGVTIGANSIIGANSVVIKSVPSNVIAFGNPARVIGWLNKGEIGSKKQEY